MRAEMKKAWSDLEPESRQAFKVFVIIIMVFFLIGFGLGAWLY